MAYLVTEKCINCKQTSCVDVCPANCFREGPNLLVIDPNDCIDCSVCANECPVDAICSDNSVPRNQKHFVRINLELSKLWPVISKRTTRAFRAERWQILGMKIPFLQLR